MATRCQSLRARLQIEDQVTLFDYNETVIPGVTVLQTTYHTLGMANYVLQFDDSMSPFIVPGDSLSHIQARLSFLTELPYHV